MATNSSNSKLQIIFISDNCECICSFFHLAVSINKLGHRVSFVSSLSCIKALPIDLSNSSNLELVPLPIDGPAGIKEEFKKFLLQAPQDFDWVMFDASAFWVPRISKKFGIHSAYVTFESAVACSSWWPSMCESGKPKSDQFTAQEFSSPVAYHSGEASTIINNLLLCDEQHLPLHYRMNKAIMKCDMVALPSYHVLDESLPERLQQISQKQVSSFGHLPQAATNAVDNCLAYSAIIQDWLDKNVKCSVVYVAFESKIPVSVAAIAQGLERSRLPFIWVTGNPQGGQTANPPDGFVERTTNYGLVCNHWVPHAHILSHPSIGGFLNNGVWSLCIEALDFGIPLILAPFSTAELPNALYIEEKGLGCMIKRHPSDGVFFSAEAEQVLKFVMAGRGSEEIRERVGTLRSVFSQLQKPYLMCFLNALIEINERNVRSNTKNPNYCSFTGCIICRDKKKNAAHSAIDIVEIED